MSRPAEGWPMEAASTEPTEAEVPVWPAPERILIGRPKVAQ